MQECGMGVVGSKEMIRLLDSMGEGEGGVIWENSIETCILSRVKQIASPGWMHETSAQGWYTGMIPEGWDGDGGGRGAQDGNTCKSMADSCQCIWQNHYNNVK